MKKIDTETSIFLIYLFTFETSGGENCELNTSRTTRIEHGSVRLAFQAVTHWQQLRYIL